MDKILIITGDAGECYETLYAIHRFKEAGYEPEIGASSHKRLHLVMHEEQPGWDTYVERPGYEVEANLAFDEVVVDDYVAVLIIGGRAPEYLRHDPRVLSIVRSFHERNKWIFAICHGIQVLICAGLVKGARLTAYEHIRSEVDAAGGTYVSDCPAVRDGKMVTAQNWGSHPEFYREVMGCLGEDHRRS